MSCSSAATTRKEISEYVGEATSNIAELSAVVRALSAIKDRDRHVILHSDSEYAIGMLTKGWKVRANKHLIEQARDLVTAFPRLRELRSAHGNRPRRSMNGRAA